MWSDDRSEWNTRGGRRHYMLWCVEHLCTRPCDWLCEVIIPLNGNTLRDHQIHQISHTCQPCYSHDLRCARSVSSCALDGYILVCVPYSFCDFYHVLCLSHALLQSASWSVYQTSPVTHCSLQPLKLVFVTLWRTHILLSLGGWIWLNLRTIRFIFGNLEWWEQVVFEPGELNDDNVEIERLGAGRGFTTPVLLRCTTSSVVYNCKSPVTLGRWCLCCWKDPQLQKEPPFL